MSDRGGQHRAKRVHEEVGRFIEVLDTLLDSLRAHDAVQPVDTGPLKFWSPGDPMSPIQGLLDDPIRKSLRLGTHLAGERLHQLGGTDLMNLVLDRVCDLGPNKYTRRAVTLNHAWNNVGVDAGRDIWVS